MTTPSPGAAARSATAAVDPLWVLWHAMGEPLPEAATGVRAGYCARCGTEDDACSRVKKVVSDKFTGWDQYTQIVDPLWCTACTWGHSTTEVRTRAWRIGGGCTMQADGATLSAELSRPVPALVSLIVPLSRHKHILPAARWGFVTTDDRTLTWEYEEAARFKAVAWLRGLGFGETALQESVPRFDVLTRHDAPTMALAMQRWDDLAEWRRDLAYLKVACAALRTGTPP